MSAFYRFPGSILGKEKHFFEFSCFFRIFSDQKFKRVFLALDTNNISAAEKLIKLLKNNLAGIKIGKELFSVYGPEIIKKFKNFIMQIMKSF